MADDSAIALVFIGLTAYESVPPTGERRDDVDDEVVRHASEMLPVNKQNASG